MVKKQLQLKIGQKTNHSFLRFDYSGHGQSSGDFNNLVYSDWLRDSVYMINHLTQGPQIIVGSSMGGWIGLNLIKKKVLMLSQLSVWLLHLIFLNYSFGIN